jgi:PAS domain S-box-containing protein
VEGDLKLKDSVFERVSRIVNSEPSQDEMLGQILGLTAQVSNCDACLVYLMEFATGEFVLRASQLPRTPELSITRMKFGEGITGHVAESQMPLALQSGAPKDPRFKSIPGLKEDTYEALLSVPLAHKGRSIGVINVHHRDSHEHTAEEIAAIVFIGEQMGAAIAKNLLEEENARLAERDRRLERQRLQLEDAVARRTEELRTAKERAEAASRQIALQAKLLAEVNEAIVATDASFTVTYWNAAAERLFGYAASAAIGTKYENVLQTTVHPDDLDGTVEYIKSRLAQRQVLDQEYRVVHPSGAIKWIWNRGFPVPDPDGGAERYVGVALDITERKELERQLTHAQKLESIGRLAAGIAHEINTPIQYIGDNGKFLEEAFGALIGTLHSAGAEDFPKKTADFNYLCAEVPKAIQHLQEGVEQVSRIVRAMKEFSHPGPAEKLPVDINRTIESTVLVSRSEWKYVAELTTDFDHELPAVPCLAGEFNQVILNLIVNAAHAITDVVKESGRMGRIHIITRCDGEAVEIRLSDTGCGIPKANQSKVFDPFFTTKPVGKGTGQGLAIAYGVIVQKHDGTIEVESDPGCGTTFIIRLPLAPEPAIRALGTNEAHRNEINEYR